MLQGHYSILVGSFAFCFYFKKTINWCQVYCEHANYHMKNMLFFLRYNVHYISSKFVLFYCYGWIFPFSSCLLNKLKIHIRKKYESLNKVPWELSKEKNTNNQNKNFESIILNYSSHPYPSPIQITQH